MRKIRKLSIIIFCLSFITISFAQDKLQSYYTLVNTASKYYKEGDYKKSLQAYQSAFSIKRDNASDFYNAACSASLAGKKSVAFNFLDTSLSLGWSNSDHLEKDQDLYNLHGSSQWKDIIVKARQNSENFSLKSVISRVESLIQSRNTKDLLGMLKIDSNLVDKIDFKNKIEFVEDFLGNNRIKRLDNLAKGSSNSSTLKDGTLIERHQKIYNLIPNFFGKHTSQLFFNPLCFEVQIILEKINGKWKLYNIELLDKRFKQEYNLEGDIGDFLNKTDSVSFRFFVGNDTRQIAGGGTISLSNLEFLKGNHELVRLNFEKIVNYEDNSNNYISLVLIKNGPKNNLPFPDFFNQSKPVINKLEFVFSRTNMKVCWISNGIGYDFYETNLTTEIEKFVKLELSSIK
ncbi:hypothetical protein SanaruYs_20430 [Chryseotalea sanaruensis]|uniref:Uncharacterized protein n=1 Tax=Chryseotalea sanaruensis TaxID=2482724 RepID=A0A401UAE4_9BACT|nr:hypothetical protein [Chryseotalea sanaruensis]GCC51814.1 hypothetical protein SanaruYs_20430 [Chryseotalea sanaruensis]